jgi:uncharacterized protein
MKKIFLSIFISIALFVNAVSAEEYLMDYANILSESEKIMLEEDLADISDLYNFGVYLVTFEDMAEYDYGEYEIEEFAEDFYMENNLGHNESKDGLMLIMSMAGRDFDIMAYGAGNEAFTDYGKDKLVDAFASAFREDEWFVGMSKYLDKVEYMLKWYERGHPYDVGFFNPAAKLEGLPMNILRALIFALIIAYFSSKAAKKGLKTISQAVTAFAYMDSSDIELTRKEDKYIRTTSSVRYISTSSGSSGGGHYGGTTVHSSGASHRSGKF